MKKYIWAIVIILWNQKPGVFLLFTLLLQDKLLLHLYVHAFKNVPEETNPGSQKKEGNWNAS